MYFCPMSLPFLSLTLTPSIPWPAKPQNGRGWTCVFSCRGKTINSPVGTACIWRLAAYGEGVLCVTGIQWGVWVSGRERGGFCVSFHLTFVFLLGYTKMACLVPLVWLFDICNRIGPRFGGGHGSADGEGHDLRAGMALPTAARDMTCVPRIALGRLGVWKFRDGTVEQALVVYMH